MKGTNDHPLRCIALSGEVGRAIYELRPTPCREFNVFEEDGSPNERCQRLRAGVAGV